MSALGIIPLFVRDDEDVALAEIAVRSFFETTNDTDLLVVNDGSPDRHGVFNVMRLLDEFPRLIFIDKHSNEGFASTVNVGLLRAREDGRDAVLINQDIQFLDGGWLDRALESEGDVVGGLLLFPNGLIQHAGIYYSVISRIFDHRFRYAPANLAAALVSITCPVTGALQLIRNSVLREVGVYDEGFRLGWEDIAYCTDVFQAGGRCVYQPLVRAIHHEGVTREDPSEKILRWREESWVHLHTKYAGHSFAEYTPTMLAWD